MEGAVSMLGVTKKKKIKQNAFRILVAEDDPQGLKLLEMILQKMKFEDIVSVADGLSAWQEFEKTNKPFDLVIADWDMPFATGMELLDQIREEGYNTPFLMVTGRGLMDSAIEAKLSGASGFITKPFSPQHMMDKIKTILPL